MQTAYNNIFSTYLFPVQILGIFSAVMNLFQAVAFSSVKGMAVGFLTLVVAFILFDQTMAGVYEESERAKKSWVAITHHTWFVKFRRSAQSMAGNVGAFYFADRGLFLTFLSIVTTNTANLVITYKS